MPEKDHAAQLHCIGWAPVRQMREMLQQLAITIRPVEHMPHHLHVMQLQVTSIIVACSQHTVAGIANMWPVGATSNGKQ